MKKRYRILIALVAVFAAGFIVPEDRNIPVVGATNADWNKDTFWYEPWGASGVHKGVDIFAVKGTAVLSPTNMLVLFNGEIAMGGKVIVGLGAKWRLHYFAHLESVDDKLGFLLATGDSIGSVGDTGNAKGKPPHLHYSILSLLPRPWHIDKATQGYKKAFYIDPIKHMSGSG